ncbi:hypothetical protein Tco_0414711 [Tanacetum coccineum]
MYVLVFIERDFDKLATLTPPFISPYSDDEEEDQELEAHYVYMAKIQKVTPAAEVVNGPIFDKEPLEHVHINNEYNVFTMENENSKPPKYVNNSYVMEQCDSNTTPNSSNMSNNRGEADKDE